MLRKEGMGRSVLRTVRWNVNGVLNEVVEAEGFIGK